MDIQKSGKNASVSGKMTNHCFQLTDNRAGFMEDTTSRRMEGTAPFPCIFEFL